MLHNNATSRAAKPLDVKSNIGEPTRIDLSISDLLRQFKLDIYGKLVQSSPTYSYLWMANQLGHIALGYGLVTLLRGLVAVAQKYELVDFLPPLAAFDKMVIVTIALVASGVVALYEAATVVSEVRREKKHFPIDLSGLVSNAFAAWLYMFFGIILAVSVTFGAIEGFLALFGLLIVGVVVAIPWLRQKIVWQRAALPFLFRLSEARRPRQTDEGHDRFINFLDHLYHWSSGDVPRHLLIVGPFSAGKTSLAAGIGTECAFKGQKVRYSTYHKLRQHIEAGYDDKGPRGRGLWPWRESQILIVDDFDLFLNATDLATPEVQWRGKIRAEVAQFKSSAAAHNQTCDLKRRNTVWIAGTGMASAHEWADAVADILDLGQTESLTTIELAALTDEECRELEG